MTTQKTIPIIDAHHHIWNLVDIPWLHGPIQPRIFGDYTSMRRDYPVKEYLQDLSNSGVVKSVYVQANWATDKALEEVQWVQSISEKFDFPHAIVGYADLSSPDCAKLLDAQMKCKNMRGVRQQLHWHKNPQYRFMPQPDLMKSPIWQKGLAEVQARGLVFDLQVFSSQMADCVDIANAFPNIKFVLSHAGMQEDDHPETVARWREGMEKLSSCKNVYSKLSGLGTFSHRCDSSLWRPIVSDTVRMFGANRCLFGTNFPIEKLWTSYGAMIQVIRDCIGHLSFEEQSAILHDTAAEIYRI